MSLTTHSPLTDDEFIELDEFLLSDENCLPIDEAHGFITSLIVSHVPINQSDWMELIWGQPVFADEDEKQRMSELMLRLYHDIAAALKTGQPFDPLVIEIEEDGETLETHQGWCFGFMLAISQDEERWNQLPQDEHVLLSPIAKLAIQHDDDELDMDDEEYQMLIDLLPGSVVGLYQYWELNDEE